MSGSYDRPTGPPTLHPAARMEHDPYYATPTTAPPPFPHARARPHPSRHERGGGEASPRRRRRAAQQTAAPIVPAGSVTGRSLTLVITIMCFLASLTAGAVYMMNQTATQWMQDMASEVTVQIETRPRVDSDRQVAEVVAFLSRQQGVAQARA